MTTTMPKIRVDAQYPIGEAAEILGITSRHLLRLAVSGRVRYTINRLMVANTFPAKNLSAIGLGEFRLEVCLFT